MVLNNSLVVSGDIGSDLDIKGDILTDRTISGGINTDINNNDELSISGNIGGTLDIRGDISVNRTISGEIVYPSRNVNTKNYNELYNKPQINTVELIGDKTFEDLGLIEIDVMEILNILI